MMIRVKSAIALLTKTENKTVWAELEHKRLVMQLKYGREVSHGEALLELD